MRKRFYRVLIALSMTAVLFGVSACGNNASDSETLPTETESTEESTTESEEETETESESTEKEEESSKEESQKEETEKSEADNKKESDSKKESESKEESKAEPSTKATDTKETKADNSNKTAESTSAPAPVHEHNYASSIIQNPTCTTNGVKTYTCSCGDTYTENLGTTAHNFSIPVTQTVHHDEVWQNVPRQTSGSRVIICGCGAEFATQADFDNHRIASLEANGPFCSCCGPFNVEDRPGETVYDYVKISDAYDEEVVVGYKCSVCGATQ